VLVTDRAMPTHNYWLKRICAPLGEGACRAVFGKTIPTPGGNYFHREDLSRNFPLNGTSADSFHFSMENCAISAKTLADFPFPAERCWDIAYAWMMKYEVEPCYQPEAIVMRPADTPLKTVLFANMGRGADMSAYGKGASFAGALRSAVSEIASDLRFCLSLKKTRYAWYPFLYRTAIHFGRYAGKFGRREA